MRHTHKTVRVTVGRHSADIDEMLAPLIQEAWTAGIATAYSCQGQLDSPLEGARLAYVTFPSAQDAERFISLVIPAERDVTYSRIVQQRHAALPKFQPHTSQRARRSSGSWEYTIDPRDNTRGQAKAYEPCSPVQFSLWITIRFPNQDIAMVLARLCRHNHRE